MAMIAASGTPNVPREGSEPAASPSLHPFPKAVQTEVSGESTRDRKPSSAGTASTQSRLRRPRFSVTASESGRHWTIGEEGPGGRRGGEGGRKPREAGSDRREGNGKAPRVERGGETGDPGQKERLERPCVMGKEDERQGEGGRDGGRGGGREGRERREGAEGKGKAQSTAVMLDNLQLFEAKVGSRVGVGLSLYAACGWGCAERAIDVTGGGHLPDRTMWHASECPGDNIGRAVSRTLSF